jgi:hypothetical protein
MAPTLQELHKIFPPEEAVRKYTHEELLKMYHSMQKSKPDPSTSTELMGDYVRSLQKGLKGGACIDNTKFEEVAQLQPAEILARYPPEEAYSMDNWQKVKALHSHSGIFGMQNPKVSNCTALLKFFQYLASLGIRRYVCLQCADSEPAAWKTVEKQYDNAIFLNKQIQDYQSYTFENAMSILACLEENYALPTVFHCTAGFGRTGSVMYLILLYFKAKKNPNVLRRKLMTNTAMMTDDQVNETELAKEYSFHAAEEFYEAHNLVLRSKRLNIANAAVAHTLMLYHPTGEHVGYSQYDTFQDLSKQSLHFAENLSKADKKEVIMLADENNMPKKKSKCKYGFNKDGSCVKKTKNAVVDQSSWCSKGYGMTKSNKCRKKPCKYGFRDRTCLTKKQWTNLPK